jgi:hypothetical protein
MQLRAGLLSVLVIFGSGAFADAPETSLRPKARVDAFPVAIVGFAPLRSLRPKMRPSGTTVGAIPAARPKSTSSSSYGQLCGNRDIRGVAVGRVPARLPGCGVADAVKVYEVAGVTLSTPATMDCDTANTLNSWMDGGMPNAVDRYGGGVTKVKVAAGYVCRTRNHRPGAPISEHGKGKAIDISVFHLKNGDTISVQNDWGKGQKGRILKELHRSACGPFGTVLGPGSDGFHEDHFHFDTANHRSGSYCR